MRSVLRIAALAAIIASAAALERPSGAPKQSIGTYVGQFLKPAKSEKDVDMGFAVVPVSLPPCGHSTKAEEGAWLAPCCAFAPRHRRWRRLG